MAKGATSHNIRAMLRSIGAFSHGVIDYLMVIILAIGPGVAGFTGKQAWFCYILAAVLFFLAVLTRFPLGAAKIIGFPLHGAIEALIAIMLITLPWMANFFRGVMSRNFFIAIGVLLGLIALLTDFRGIRGRAAISSSTTSSTKTSSTTTASPTTTSSTTTSSTTKPSSK
jgi:hypothetical protein